MEITNIKAQRALSVTGIDIADFVINPYKGCEFGCLYCYAKQNKTMHKRSSRWGEFVDIKENITQLLSEELKNARSPVKRVLIGSVTEPYQPVENEMRITRRIIEMLTEHNVQAVILTRSPLVCRDMDILKQGRHKIFFTINTIKDKVKAAVEPDSPVFEERLNAVKELFSCGVDVRVHIGPVIPGITDIGFILSSLPGNCRSVEAELYNFKMGSWEQLASALKEHAPEALNACLAATESQRAYNNFCMELKAQAENINKDTTREMRFFFPPYNSFFDNKQYHYEV